MATTTSNFTTFGTESRASAVYTNWGPTAANAETSNDSRAVLAGIAPESVGHTDYLTCKELATEITAGNVPSEIRVKIERKRSQTNVSVKDSQVCLIVGGTIQTSVNKADTGTEWTDSDAIITYTFTQANLTTLSIATATTVNAADFGVAFSGAIDDTGSGNGVAPQIDHVWVEIDHAPPPAGGATLPITGVQ